MSVEVDSFDLQRATPPGQAAPSPALVQTEPEKYDDSKVRSQTQGFVLSFDHTIELFLEFTLLGKSTAVEF